jgi:predicted amidophosphoribosyltransferase
LCIARDAVIVPIPLAPIKQATRGFNQAEIFGQELARLTGRPAVPRVLCRARGGPAQATLEDAVARRANARGKFAVRVPFGAGRRFVVVDDVATTRATLGDAARALKEAGAGEVWGVTVLRG